MKANCLIQTFTFLLVSQVLFSQNMPDYDPKIDYQKKAYSFVSSDNHDSLFLYTDYYYRQSNERQDWANSTAALQIKCRYYYQQKNHTAFKKLAIEIVNIAEKHLQNEPGLALAYSNYAYIYLPKGDYIKAIKYHNLALDIVKNLKDNKSDAALYLANLGYDYFELGDIEEAKSHYSEAIEILKKIESSHESYQIAERNIIFRTISLANCERELKNYNSSFNLLNINESRLGKFNSRDIFYKRLVLRNTLNTCRTVLALNLPEQTLQTIKKAEAIVKLYPEEDDGTIEALKAQAYNLNNNFTLAEEYYLKALAKKSKLYRLDGNFAKISKAEYVLSKFYFEQNDFIKSVKHAHNGICNIFPDLNTDKINDIPSDSDYFTPQKVLIDLLFIKARSLHQLKEDSANIIYCLDHLQFCVKIINKIRNEYYSESAKLESSKQTEKIYSLGHEISKKLYLKTKDEHYNDLALMFLDQNKSKLLQDQNTKKLTQKQLQIPEADQQKENDLIFDIKYEKEELIKLKNKGSSESEVQLITSKIFNLNRRLKEVQDSLKVVFPTYDNLTIKESNLTVEEIQNNLEDDSYLFVEYFTSHDKIYVAFVSKGTIDFEEIEGDKSFIEKINTFSKICSNPPDLAKHESVLAAYKATAYYLYENLLGSYLNDHPEIKNLIIIPDGDLNLISFEALLTDNSTAENYKSLPYLVNNFSVNYNYAGSLFIEYQNQAVKKFSSDVTAYLPTFENYDLLPLECAKEEVAFIEDNFKSNIFRNAEASMKNISAFPIESNVLHLSTHTAIDTINPAFSKIFFTDKALSNYELPKLKINANQVVLGICNSGTGKLAKGEGLLSISKDFQAIGIPSMIVTKWEVDDCTTSSIFKSYYNKLFSGATKTNALRIAKLNYLESSPKAKAHPFYWAALNHIGNDKAIKSNSYASQIILIFCVCLGLFLFAFIIKKS